MPAFSPKFLLHCLEKQRRLRCAKGIRGAGTAAAVYRSKLLVGRSLATAFTAPSRARYHLRLMNHDVTQLLHALERGDPHAAEELLPLF